LTSLRVTANQPWNRLCGKRCFSGCENSCRHCSKGAKSPRSADIRAILNAKWPVEQGSQPVKWQTGRAALLLPRK